MKTKKNDNTAANASARRRRVAVMRLSSLGDVAMVIPVLYAACRQNPETDFVFVTKKSFAGLCVGKPDNLSLQVVDTEGRHKGLTGLMQLARDLNCDSFIDLHNVLRSQVVRILLRMSGVKVTVFDKARDAKRRLIQHGAGDAPEVTPTVVRYADAFARAGFQATRLSPVPVDLRIPADRGIPDKEPRTKWVGIAPFAAHKTKVYPIDRLHKVAEKLLETRRDVRLLLFGGGKEETERLNAFASDLPGTIVVAGRGLGFAGELALMSKLDVMVSMDSGNMHLAAIAGAPTISIWGPTHPAAGFTPVTCSPGQRHVFLQSAYGYRRPCSVFGDKPCSISCSMSKTDVPPCLGTLLPGDILDAVNDVIGPEI